MQATNKRQRDPEEERHDASVEGNMQALVQEMQLPRATPTIVTRGPCKGASEGQLAAGNRVVAAAAAGGPISQADIAQLSALLAANRNIFIPALKADPVKVEPAEWDANLQSLFEQDDEAAKTACVTNLGVADGCYFMLTPKPGAPRDPRSPQSVVLNCTLGEQALLQPYNNSSWNGSPALLYLLPSGVTSGGQHTYELPPDSYAYQLETNNKRLQESVHNHHIDRLACIKGTTTLRPVLSPSNGAHGVGAARIGRGGLIPHDPQAPPFTCDLDKQNIKGCMSALLMSAAALVGVPIIVNHKTALSFRFDLRRSGAWSKGGSTGGEASMAAQRKELGEEGFSTRQGDRVQVHYEDREGRPCLKDTPGAIKKTHGGASVKGRSGMDPSLPGWTEEGDLAAREKKSDAGAVNYNEEERRQKKKFKPGQENKTTSQLKADGGAATATTGSCVPTERITVTATHNLCGHTFTKELMGNNSGDGHKFYRVRCPGEGCTSKAAIAFNPKDLQSKSMRKHWKDVVVQKS